MKWFVTDAQLAALRDQIRAEITDAHQQAFQATLNAHVARYDAEIARLRDDRREELQRLADPQGPFVAHLQAEVAFWRVQYQHERQRCEVQLDQCRAMHEHIGPVSLPLREDGPLRPHVPTPEELELSMVGSADGV